MFDLSAKRLVWIPVLWGGVEGEGDGLARNTKFEIQCQVEIVDSERLEEIFGNAKKGAVSSLSEVEKFKAIVHDWRGVKNGGVSAPMTDENVAIMLRVPMFAGGFESSYIDAWTGQLETREKNSEGSPSDGRAEEAPAKRK